MNTFARFAVSLGMASVLTACGGGGEVEPISANGFSIARFVGQWQNTNPNPVCERDPLNNVYVSESIMVMKATTYSESYDYFLDSACTNYLGSSYSAFEIEWSLPKTSATKNGAIRARIFNPTYSTSGEVRPPAITSDPTVSYKILFDVDNHGLSSYIDVTSPNLDDEGYPLGDAPPLFTYTR